MNVPRVNTNDDTTELLRLLAADGDRVEAGQDIAELGTSKATVVLQADQSGHIAWHARQYDVVAVGALLASFHPSAEKAAAAIVQVKSVPRVERESGFDFVRLSSAAAKWAAEHDVDVAQLAGRGLVTVRMLSTAQPARVDLERLGVKRSERIARVKRLEIEQLQRGESGNVTSALTVQLSTSALRKALEPTQRTIAALVLHETARLLKRTPKLTAFVLGDEWHFYDRVDLGVALDLGDGLVVAAIRDADTLTVAQLDDRISDFQLRYARQTLEPAELSGSTFTVTDLSSQNVLSFRPLLNGLQSAILGVGGDATLPDQPLTLTLAFDHRISSGLEVAEFLNELKQALLAHAKSLGPNE